MSANDINCQLRFPLAKSPKALENSFLAAMT